MLVKGATGRLLRQIFDSDENSRQLVCFEIQFIFIKILLKYFPFKSN